MADKSVDPPETSRKFGAKFATQSGEIVGGADGTGAKRLGPGEGYRALTREEKDASIARTLASRPEGEPFRLFAFGSLMWNPEFKPASVMRATVTGYRRCFRIWTVRARGCIERPGLGLCLVPEIGARCTGQVLEMPEETLQEDLVRLWDREQHSGVYRPEWIEMEGEQGRVSALTYVAVEEHCLFAGTIDKDDMVAIIAGAEGVYGPNHVYVSNLVEEMQKLDVFDPDIEELDRRVQALLCDQD